MQQRGSRPYGRVSCACHEVEVEMTPVFRSSGIVIQPVQQVDGRHEIVGVQVNIVPVTPADEGKMDMVVRAAMGTFNDYPTSMTKAEIIDALLYAVDQLKAQR